MKEKHWLKMPGYLMSKVYLKNECQPYRLQKQSELSNVFTFLKAVKRKIQILN